MIEKGRKKGEGKILLHGMRQIGGGASVRRKV